jgi:hypothetical protein
MNMFGLEKLKEIAKKGVNTVVAAEFKLGKEQVEEEDDDE